MTYYGRFFPTSRVRERQWARAFRADALLAQDSRCAYCKAPITIAEATADHVRPRSRGGQTTRANIKAACELCNTGKGSMPAGKFKALLHSRTVPVDACFAAQLAWARHRIWKRADLACRRIERAAA